SWGHSKNVVWFRFSRKAKQPRPRALSRSRANNSRKEPEPEHVPVLAGKRKGVEGHTLGRSLRLRAARIKKRTPAVMPAPGSGEEVEKSRGQIKTHTSCGQRGRAGGEPPAVGERKARGPLSTVVAAVPRRRKR